MPPRPDPLDSPSLRAWQRKALVEYLRRRSDDFMAVATPGAGKTTFALRIAAELLADGTVEAVTVVCPTEHLKTQWAAAAARVGIQLDHSFRNADVHSSRDFHGAVLTYAQVGMAPAVHRRRTITRSTFVILDEIHHAGDSRTWGDGVKNAFDPAVRRLMLTGTPFRSDENPIPFVSYERGQDGLQRSRADSVYGYSDALRDGVVRPVLFMAYSGETRWRTNAAGGLVIASDQQTARAYAKLLHDITGESAVVVLSDDAGASERIATFALSQQRWLVAVRMVSEGVDIPRLAVGVYATSASTPLYFAQAIGRFVRARRQGETATVFLPSVPHLLGLASEMEAQRNHVLGAPKDPDGLDDALLERAQRAEDAEGELAKRFEALSATAELDQVIFDGASFGTGARAGTPEEEEYLGLPGLLTPDQVSVLLNRRQSEQLAAQKRQVKETVPAPREPVALSAGERRVS